MPSFGIPLGSETGVNGSIANKRRNNGSSLSVTSAKCGFIDDAQHNNIQHLSATCPPSVWRVRLADFLLLYRK